MKSDMINKIIVLDAYKMQLQVLQLPECGIPLRSYSMRSH